MSFKIVVVGDGSVGKTCLLMSYAYNNFPNEYQPTVFDNYDTDVMVNGSRYKMHLFDTAGQSDYDHIRPLSYARADGFLVCFSISNRSSLQNVADKWWPELQKHCPGVPMLLVGTKSDLRDGDSKKSKGPAPALLKSSDGDAMAKRINAVAYMECSALTQAGLKNVFDRIITIALERPRPSVCSQCVIL